jgi:carboxyvinyl-carboxyphosphonate phosphorylmutase
MTTYTDTEKRGQFRALISGGRVLHPASVFDPLSARSAEDLGFEAAMLAGSVASLAVLGAPDLVVLTLTELADLCRRICRAGNLPLLVDADHGFGNAISVQRTVQELEAAGVAALTIEDTLLPKPFGSTAKDALISIEEGVGKIVAAVEARRDKSLVIAGRTNLERGPLDEIVQRAAAYEKAGADAIFLSGPKTREQIRAVSAATSVPLILGRITEELDDKGFLLEHRVYVVLQGHKPYMAAVKAAHDALAALRAGTQPADIKTAVNADLLDKLTRQDNYDQLAQKTLQKQ